MHSSLEIGMVDKEKFEKFNMPPPSEELCPDEKCKWHDAYQLMEQFWAQDRKLLQLYIDSPEQMSLNFHYIKTAVIDIISGNPPKWYEDIKKERKGTKVVGHREH
jgi:hypothetical protein|tara:strand:+ start:182 stop:496 length:315 start_codon:yes stop_codon:yes gene_type:complete